MAATTDLLLSDDAGFLMEQALFVKSGTLVGKALLWVNETTGGQC